MSNCAASCTSVRSPLIAAIATFALKADVWFRRGLLLMLSPDSRANLARCQAEAPLIALCRFPKPALRSVHHYPNSGAGLAPQGDVRHRRDATCSVPRLDRRSFGAGPNESLRSVWIDPVRSDDGSGARLILAPRHLASDHVRHHLVAHKAQSGARRTDPKGHFQLDANYCGLLGWGFCGRTRDLSGVS